MVLFGNEDAEGFLSYSTVHNAQGTCSLVLTLRVRASLVNEMSVFFVCEETGVRILRMWFS